MKNFHAQNINLILLEERANIFVHQQLGFKLTLLTKINIAPRSFSIIPYYVPVTEQSTMYVLSHLIL